MTSRAGFLSRRMVASAAVAAIVSASAVLTGFTGVASAFCGKHGICNEPPRVAVKVGKPSSSAGAVRVWVMAKDSDYKRIRIHVPAKTSKGTITQVLRRDGSSSGTFTYTPTAAARHQAASETASASDQTDTFTVTVTDGYGGTTSTAVTVPVTPQNSPPVAGAPTVGQPDPSTGVVTGQVNATDPDGDPLSYAVATPPTKGTVAVSPDGSFTYTPTLPAPQSRGESTDTFTITITDGYGGAVSAFVSVP